MNLLKISILVGHFVSLAIGDECKTVEIDKVGEAEGWIPQGVISNDFTKWVKDFHRVDMVVYNPNAERRQELVKNEKVHAGLLPKLTKALTPEEVKRLKGLVTGKHKDKGSAFCYEPHNGFLFYDKENKIVGHLEICFLCGNYESNPKNGLSEFWDLKGLEKLIRKKDVPYYETIKEWNEFFAKNMKDGK